MCKKRENVSPEPLSKPVADLVVVFDESTQATM